MVEFALVLPVLAMITFGMLTAGILHNRSAEAERERLRAVLDGFEARYGLSCDRLVEAFLDDGGDLVESDEWRAWDEVWAAWQILSKQ